jgi:phosphatidylglycerophosphatase C
MTINRKIRDASFRRQVCEACDDRCPVTRLKIINGGGRSEVQAAHIRPVGDGGPDVVQNGIALSGTVHWLFDRHLISLTDEDRLLVSHNRVPSEPRGLFASQMDRIHLSEDPCLRPRPAYVARHRRAFVEDERRKRFRLYSIHNWSQSARYSDIKRRLDDGGPAFRGSRRTGQAMLAVFDLDGTLLDGDSTALWLWGRVRRSLPRAIVTLLVAPVAVPMVLIPRTRRAGASILLWIATVGLSEPALRASCADFAERFRTGALPLRWRNLGLAALDAHLAAGDRVVIVTAAPAMLAQALVAPLDRPIVVLGTSLKRRAGGWVADVHCRNLRKCQALAEAGHGVRWAYAYTDSLDDLPLLRGADRPTIVKGGQAAQQRLSRAGLPHGQASAW